ncbi:MAG: LTA synthase family protein, partial [Clostridia bacterium]|nr:LTA synthase family protein [Clostridia bacterium]
LESMENTFADKQNNSYNIDFIPELTTLANENISFSNTDGVGGILSFGGTNWTAAAMVSQTSGVTVKVPFSADAYGDNIVFIPGIVSIGEVLEKQGYNQTVLMGSDAYFHGRETYFTDHGNYNILDTKSLKATGRLDKDYREWWGFEDEKLFTFAKEELTRLSMENKPFNFTMLTADTHFPNGYKCRLCKENHDEQYANVLECSSKQVASFVEWIKTQDFYKNTTIIICGDHLTMDSDFLSGVDDDYVRTNYNCIINSAVTTQKQNNRKFGSFDMFPTTLAAMGVKIKGERVGLGTNLFSNQKTLTEEYGFDVLNNELKKQSKFYNKEFLGVD